MHAITKLTLIQTHIMDILTIITSTGWSHCTEYGQSEWSYCSGEASPGGQG